MKPCLDCNAIGKWGRDGRCDKHRKARTRKYEANPVRRAYKAERYNAAYQRTRAMWVPIVATNKVICPRCNTLIEGQFDLDHINNTLHPSHAHCNRGKKEWTVQ